MDQSPLSAASVQCSNNRAARDFDFALTGGSLHKSLMADGAVSAMGVVWQMTSHGSSACTRSSRTNSCCSNKLSACEQSLPEHFLSMFRSGSDAVVHFSFDVLDKSVDSICFSLALSTRITLKLSVDSARRSLAELQWKRFSRDSALLCNNLLRILFVASKGLRCFEALPESYDLAFVRAEIPFPKILCLSLPCVWNSLKALVMIE